MLLWLSLNLPEVFSFKAVNENNEKLHSFYKVELNHGAENETFEPFLLQSLWIPYQNCFRYFKISN